MEHLGLQYPDLNKLDEAIRELLAAPATDPRVVPMAEHVIEALRAMAANSEDLRRYRETRERMGAPDRQSVAPPNFAYTLHSS